MAALLPGGRSLLGVAPSRTGGALRPSKKEGAFMFNSAKYLLSAIGALTLVTPSAAAAPRSMTSFELRDQFAQCGFETGNPGVRSTSPYVVVRDPGGAEVRGANYRIVMAVV